VKKESLNVCKREGRKRNLWYFNEKSKQDIVVRMNAQSYDHEIIAGI
jgi:hypothetical protein